MPDQTKPRVWNAGDPEPADRPKVKDRRATVWTATPYPDEDVWTTEWNEVAQWPSLVHDLGPLTEVQTSSPVSSPAEPGNASERPNQPGGTTPRAALNTVLGRLSVSMAAAGKQLRRDLEAIGMVPAHDLDRADATEAMLREVRRDWSELSHIVGGIEDDPAEEVHERARKLVARADAAEAKLAIADDHHQLELSEAGRLLKAAERRAYVRTQFANLWRAERDEARAKLDEIRSLIDGMKSCSTADQHNTQNREVLNRIRRFTHVDEPVTTIADPEAGR